MAINHAERQRRLAVDWAASTLSLLGCQIESHDDGWDVETNSGWKSPADWRELVLLAQAELAAYQSARMGAL